MERSKMSDEMFERIFSASHVAMTGALGATEVMPIATYRELPPEAVGRTHVRPVSRLELVGMRARAAKGGGR